MVIRELGAISHASYRVGNTPDAALPTMFGLRQPGNPAQIAATLNQAGVPAGLSQTIGAAVARSGVCRVLDGGGPGVRALSSEP